MISGEPGSRWIVQATDDFRHWRQIAVVESGFETEFCDRGSRQHRARAYRVQAEFALPQFNLPTPGFLQYSHQFRPGVSAVQALASPLNQARRLTAGVDFAEMAVAKSHERIL
jgi:hypothetical protein